MTGQDGGSGAVTGTWTMAREDGTTEEILAEEPLEVRLDGHPVAVLMRTPGADFELAVGFLHAEGLIDAAAEVAGVSYCREAGETRGPTNRVSVATYGEVGRGRVEGRVRRVAAGSACGLCGRTVLEMVHQRHPPPHRGRRPGVAELLRALATLRQAQPLFARTGTAHAAGIFDASGTLRVAYEDLGRHNAVDKCVGALALRGALPLTGHLLAVSGRVSFEIVQKALAAGIPWIAAVGGPTHLALELARSAGMGVAAWVREDRARKERRPEDGNEAGPPRAEGPKVEQDGTCDAAGRGVIWFDWGPAARRGEGEVAPRRDGTPSQVPDDPS